MAKPETIADRAFEDGFWVAALAGAGAVVMLYASEVLSVTSGPHLFYTLLFYPVYLLIVSVALGVWLGYETDATDLERVTEELDEESTDSWENWPW